MYRVGSDHLGFSTGGALRMEIDANGNVGIGTTSPGEVLEVAGNINSTGGDICITGGNCLSEAGGGLWTNSSGNATFTSGNVGIGTTSPDTTLMIQSAVTNYDALTDTPVVSIDGTAGTFSARLSFGMTGNGFSDIPVIQSEYSPPNAGYNILAINPYGGYVGIGTTSPGYKLDVNGSAVGFIARVLNNHATDGYGLVVQAGDSSSEYILGLNSKDSGGKFLFQADGDASCFGGVGCWTEVSSEKFKDNIKELDKNKYEQMLKDLVNTSLYDFTMKNDSTQSVYTGIIAEYSPDYVTQNGGNFTSPTQLAVWALGSIKALEAKNQEQQTQIDAMKQALCDLNQIQFCTK